MGWLYREKTRESCRVGWIKPGLLWFSSRVFGVMSCRIVSFRVSACQVSWGPILSVQVGVVEFGRDPGQLRFIDAINFETVRVESCTVLSLQV
jgi:hypothetical protein